MSKIDFNNLTDEDKNYLTNLINKHENEKRYMKEYYQEYNKKNSERMKKYRAKYYKDNKSKIDKYKKDRYQLFKEKKQNDDSPQLLDI